MYICIHRYIIYEKGNGKWKWQISVCLLQMEAENGNDFVGRKSINGNRQLLFQQMCPCPSMSVRLSF